MKKHVYSFGGGTADGDGKLKDLLGGRSLLGDRGRGAAGAKPAKCRCGQVPFLSSALNAPGKAGAGIT